ncbi:microtubule-associated tumor suppressor candidate 2 isoform X2 [Megalops cyprinoides]|uniref:microtubule-associated tumor suppressor candidate 2 isoform X2 n=1 Tax=Megalops cyprinoides TaxID=118141 RepID=UPI001865604A|nr:microtubule-associated tumor suppressor candidate 2 isoform X2 [Megalops cyprinoides]
MNLQGKLSGPLVSGLQDHSGEIKNNNNKPALLSPEGDANANKIQTGDGGSTADTGTLPPLVSQSDEQDKIIIWGTDDSPCDDPELEEFELLECQELEAFLVEEEVEYERGRSDVGAEKGPPSFNKCPPSCVPAPAKMVTDRDSNRNVEDERTSGHGVQDPETPVSCLRGSRGRAGAQLSSENNVFVSCLSAVSELRGSLATVLDNAGRTLAADSRHIPSEPYRTISEDLSRGSQSITATSVKTGNSLVPSGRSTAHSNSVDLNLNSTALPQELCPQAQPDQVASQRLRKSLQEERANELTNGMGKSKGNRVDQKGEQFGLQQAKLLWTEGEQNGSEVTNKQGSGMPAESKKNFGDRMHPSDQVIGHSQSTTHPPGKSQSRLWTCPSLETVTQRTSHKMNGRPFQDNVTSEINSNHLPSNAGSKVTPGLTAAQEPKPIRKQGSGEHERSASPSSLDRRTQVTRKPWGSPTRPATPVSPRSTGSPRKRLPTSPAKAPAMRPSQQENSKVCVSSGIPKPILQHMPRGLEKELEHKTTEKSPPPKYPPKPKNVRPKIITYIRKSPHVKPHVPDTPYEASTLPSRLSAYNSSPAAKDPKAGGDPKASPVLSASNLLYDKYRQEMQKARLFSPGLVVSGIKPPSHTIPHKMNGKSDSFYGGLADKCLPEMVRGAVSLGGPGHWDSSGPQLKPHEATGLFQSPRVLRPQLGLGAVNRLPFNKNKMLLAGQRPPSAFSQPVQAVSPTAHSYQEPSGDQKKPAPALAPKSFLPKPGQSGLRPPGYSRLPATRLAAFGFVRSGSVSSVSSVQSNDSTRSDPCRPAHRLSSASDDPPFHRVTAPPGDPPRAPSRGSPLPPSTPALARRSFVPPPRGSPVASRKEIQKDVEVVRPVVSSPKRCAVVSPKPQSPVHVRLKPVAVQNGVAGGSPRADAQGRKEAERVEAQQLRERCEEQAKQLLSVRAELRRATRGLEVFAITTQHFSQKSEDAIAKERELSLELSKIREEVASNAARWERLQREKEELEQSFERELRSLQAQQEAELGALEEGLRARHSAERDRLRADHQAELDELRTQQQEQIEEMTVNHEAAMEEMENTHSVAMATLQEEHAATVRELRVTHEEQRRSLEEDFENLRLSLQDQVDTLTFQNRSLKDRAKRFEEALRKSADEQIVDALAPYQHIQEDLKSLKEVLEMKNQQIHEQEKKIADLEKMAQKNVFLEERMQVLQQQNEDLKARIDRNLVLSRQLSEENANLQEHVEKETNEKKRLSRNNEELLWRLQTGDLSPRMSPCSSPLHRASPGPASPSRLQPFPQ